MPKGKKSRPVVLKPSKNQNFASPGSQYKINRGDALSKLFNKLQVNNNKEEEGGIMLVYFMYEWYEGELPGQPFGSRLRAKKRSTTNILLFGLMTLKQIQTHVVDDGNFVHVIIDVPPTFLSVARNAAMVGSRQAGFVGCGEAMISSRVTSA